MVVFLIAIILLSITLHEYAHGWIADKLGDPTPRLSGRLSLNPWAHIDPFGTIMLPILILLIAVALTGQPFTIGYAKPVPINPYHFRNPKKDMMWVGVAGPLTNLLIATLLSLVWQMKIAFLADVLAIAILINLVLAIFNFIPIPPLDGSRILASFLPNKMVYKYLKMEAYGFLIIAVFIMLGLFNWFILPLVSLMLNLLGVKGVI